MRNGEGNHVRNDDQKWGGPFEVVSAEKIGHLRVLSTGSFTTNGSETVTIPRPSSFALHGVLGFLNPYHGHDVIALMGAWGSLNLCHVVLKPIRPCAPLGIGLIE